MIRLCRTMHFLSWGPNLIILPVMFKKYYEKKSDLHTSMKTHADSQLSLFAKAVLLNRAIFLLSNVGPAQVHHLQEDFPDHST